MATAMNHHPPTNPMGIKMHEMVPNLGKVVSMTAYKPPTGMRKSWTINFVRDDGTRIRAVLNEGRRYFEFRLI